jgi:hypothetical protein
MPHKPVEVNLYGRFVGWSDEPVAGSILALAYQRDAAVAELAELRAKIAELCSEVRNVRLYGERGSSFQVGAAQLARSIERTLASSGSAPTRQEER